jgi:hypothetical protein
MKKVVLILMTLGLVSGCAPQQLSQRPHPNAAQVAQVPAPVERDIPAKDRAASKEFYLDIHLSDDSGTRDGKPQALSFSEGIENGYRAATPINIGAMHPNQIEVSFPMPPEVETPEQAQPVLLLGCEFGKLGDIYFKVADVENLTFATEHGMLRGHFTSKDQIAAVFNFCEQWPVSVQIKFLTQNEQALSYEQVYLDSENTAPPIGK